MNTTETFPPADSCRVVAVDVGSVRGAFAWAALDLPARDPVGSGGSDPEGAAVAVFQALVAGVPVALGFECPLMVPVSPVGEPDGWVTLGKARHGETVDGRSRPWSAPAGAATLATGVVQLAWVLERVARDVPGQRCTTSPETWRDGGAELLVWEAFVSGAGKPIPAGVSQHAADAAAAAATFADRMADGGLADSDVTIDPPATPFNVAAAAALYAGLVIDPAEVRAPVYVCRTRAASRRG